MEEIIKELTEFIEDRYIPDCEILMKEMKMYDDRLEDKRRYGSFSEYSKEYHRYVDLLDLITAYNQFKDRLNKVSNNINYDNNHRN